jgi:hypothetical protein
MENYQQNQRVLYNLKSLVQKSDKIKENSTHYIIQCPKCLRELNYQKLKLYITKDYKVGYCFRCSTVYINSTLSIDFDIRYLLKDLITKFKKEETSKIDVSYYFNSDPIYYNDFAYQYLINRNPKLNIHEINKLGLRKRDNEIVIPFKDLDNKIIYFQIRYIEPPRKGLKYYNPKGTKPLYIIKNEKMSADAIVCEGVFSAIASKYFFSDKTIIAILGNRITNDQLNTLIELTPKRLFIFLDNNELSNRLAFYLSNKLKLIDDIRVPSFNYNNDPEELLIKGVKIDENKFNNIIRLKELERKFIEQFKK